jgi:hypothetical protein
MSTLVENIESLPMGRAPLPVLMPHFPDALHAVIWRNWDVIAVDVLAEVLHGTPEQITAIAASMGLPPQRAIGLSELRRNYMTVLRHNWHLLPYEQLCQIIGWEASEIQFALNEDDFLWMKLGGYKPLCPPVRYAAPDAETRQRASEIAAIVKAQMGNVLESPAEIPYDFIERFSAERFTLDGAAANVSTIEGFQYCVVYPYFLRYGDPLRGTGVDDIPEGYLAELAASGVSAIWFQGVLNTLAPWDYAPDLSHGWEERIANLNRLVERCAKYGMQVLMYLNEPRAMPRSFYDKHPEIRGIDEIPDRAAYSPDIVALCTSTQPVQDFLVNSVKHVFEQAPGLGGIVAITFSENLTNCCSREFGVVDEFALRSTVDEEEVAAPADWSNFETCPRCMPRGYEVVNAEVCSLLERGMREAGSDGKFILYAWSTPEAWFPELVKHLPKSTYLQCVSEWGKTFTRGDYTGKINEYSISEVGPSDQSRNEWKIAQEAGLKISAKMQAANTYEFSSIPYIPALRLVGEHLSNVAKVGVSGVMLGWTAGGSPSPNLELVAEFARSPQTTVHDAMLAVAEQRFGAAAAPGVVDAWNLLSDGYAEFPFEISVCYFGPQSLGPASLLWAEPTGFAATMSTFPFDDFAGWRGPYSEATFQSQFEKVAATWKGGVEILNGLRTEYPSSNLEDEWRIAEAAYLHFKSTANQAHFMRVRKSDPATAVEILRDEIVLARQLMDLVAQDSRIGFEASNQYGYILLDLGEKILNCEHLIQHFSA